MTTTPEAQPSSASSAGVTLRAIAPSVFLPALINEIGNGAIAPVIALAALRDGASPSTAGFIVALLGIGQVLGDLPAASLADRLGDRRAMILAAGIAVLAQLTSLLAPDVIILGAGLTVIGMCNATFYLARQSYVTEVVPSDLRARAVSTLAGSHRIGLFIGPFVGAAVIGFSDLRAAFVVAMLASAGAAFALLVIPDAPTPPGNPVAVRGGVSTRQTLLTHRRLFMTLGLAVVAVGAVRAARQTVLPLWAAHIGLSPATTSVIFGIASAFDMALFYPSGKVMDHFGRLWIAVPAMVVLGGAMMALPLTGDIVGLTLVAVVMSTGNGFGSGMIMTIGGDAAPLEGRTRFLSIWRVMGDTGNAAGPTLVSIVATVWTLAAGIVAVGSCGLLAAAGLAVWVPRYSPWATHAMVRSRRQSHPTDVRRAGPQTAAPIGSPAARDDPG